MRKQEEERKRREAEEEEREKMKIERAEKRDHPHIYLWLKTKIQILRILFYQKRFEDCDDCLFVLRKECKEVNDQLFLRQIMEVSFMMTVYKGDVVGAIKEGKAIKTHANNYNQNDIQYVTFMGNFSEFLYNKDKRADTGEIIREVRMVLLKRLRQLGLEINNQNINTKEATMVNKNRVKVNEEILAQY